MKELKLDEWRDWFNATDVLKIVAEEPHKLGWLIGKDKLNSLHSEWIRYTWDSNEPRALQSFRGGYKSTSIVVVGTIRWLLFHPNDRIAIIRKTHNDAVSSLESIKQAFDLPQVKELFKLAHGHYPKIVAAPNGKIRFNFKTAITPEPNVMALGLDSNLTGSHFDKILCDDIISLKDRVSRAERVRTAEMVRELATNIIDPGKGSLWIGTPWHKEDAWGAIRQFTDIVKYPLSKFSFLEPEDVERKKQSTTPFLFSANYELELQSDENKLFNDPVYVNGWDYTKSSVAQLDAAFGGGHYNALTIMNRINDTHYQVVGFCYEGNIKDWRDKVVRLCRQYKVSYLYNETNPDKGFTADMLAKAGLRVKTYAEKENKHNKISTYAYEFWPYLRFYSKTDPEYMNQILDYSIGQEPDDAPDSLASLICRHYKPVGSKASLWS